jgi:hypothetical protein
VHPDSDEALDLRDDWERRVEENAALKRELAALRGAPAGAAGEPEFCIHCEAVAYEQAAKWCEDRAERIRQRGRSRPESYGGDAEGVADWVQGCADTIRHNASQLRGPTTEDTE